MPVGSFPTDSLFTFRVVKYLSTNPDRKWANSYEFQSETDGDESTLLGVGVALVEFEAALELPDVVFDSLLVSTWEPDSVPYNPATFISTTLTAVGTRTGSGDPLGLTQVLSISRIANSGRRGHIYLRRYLCEGDVESPAGTTVLTNRPDVQTQVEAAITSSGLDDYLGPTDTRVIHMVMVNSDGTQVRAVQQLQASGVVTLPINHAWFNRTSPTPP